MRRLLMVVASASLALSACAAPGQLASPSSIADTTKADEQVGLTVTLAYTAASRAAALAIQLAAATGHPMSSATVQRIGQLDNEAYRAVTAVRSAYLSANAASYEAALASARAAVAALSTSAGAKPVSLNASDHAHPFASAAMAHRQLHAGA